MRLGAREGMRCRMEVGRKGMVKGEGRICSRGRRDEGNSLFKGSNSYTEVAEAIVIFLRCCWTNPAEE
jgi:hypothetical protein